MKNLIIVCVLFALKCCEMHSTGYFCAIIISTQYHCNPRV